MSCQATPNSCNLAEIFSYAVVYGLYLILHVLPHIFYAVLFANSLYSVILVIVIIETNFFHNKFSITLSMPPGTCVN